MMGEENLKELLEGVKSKSINLEEILIKINDYIDYAAENVEKTPLYNEKYKDFYLDHNKEEIQRFVKGDLREEILYSLEEYYYSSRDYYYKRFETLFDLIRIEEPEEKKKQQRYEVFYVLEYEYHGLMPDQFGQLIPVFVPVWRAYYRRIDD